MLKLMNKIENSTSTHVKQRLFNEYIKQIQKFHNNKDKILKKNSIAIAKKPLVSIYKINQLCNSNAYLKHLNNLKKTNKFEFKKSFNSNTHQNASKYSIQLNKSKKTYHQSYSDAHTNVIENNNTSQPPLMLCTKTEKNDCLIQSNIDLSIEGSKTTHYVSTNLGTNDYEAMENNHLQLIISEEILSKNKNCIDSSDSIKNHNLIRCNENKPLFLARSYSYPILKNSKLIDYDNINSFPKSKSVANIFIENNKQTKFIVSTSSSSYSLVSFNNLFYDFDQQPTQSEIGTCASYTQSNNFKNYKNSLEIKSSLSVTNTIDAFSNHEFEVKNSLFKQLSEINNSIEFSNVAECISKVDNQINNNVTMPADDRVLYSPIIEACSSNQFSYAETFIHEKNDIETASLIDNCTYQSEIEYAVYEKNSNIIEIIDCKQINNNSLRNLSKTNEKIPKNLPLNRSKLFKSSYNLIRALYKIGTNTKFSLTGLV